MQKRNYFSNIWLAIIINLLLISCSEEQETKVIEAKKLAKVETESSQQKNKDQIEKPHIKALTKPEREKQIFGRNLTANDDDIILGNNQATVTVIEYFSPTCPHCAYYKKNTFPKLQKQYITTGKIKYVMREFIGNKQDLDAAILARCSDEQNTYLKFINVILASQESWCYSKNYREILTNIGIMGGVSAERYAICLNNKEKLKILISNTQLASKQPRFGGTPAFFINGKHLLPPYSVKRLSKAIDNAIEKKQ